MDHPALLGEAPVRGADVALGVRVNACVAGVPEGPDVLLIRDGLGMKEIVINFRIWVQVEEVSRDGMEPCWEWVDFGVHCVLF